MSAVEHAAKYSSDVLSESIQNYRREKDVKKIRKRKENGWDEVNREMRTVVPEMIEKPEFKISPMSQDIQIAYAGWPYCIEKKKLTKVMVCFENDRCYCSQGCCFSCFKEDGVFHRLINLRNRENYVNGRDLKDKSFIEVCPCEGDIYFYYSKKK